MTDHKKYIEHQFLDIGYRQPYSEHILISGILLVLAKHFGIDLESETASSKTTLYESIINSYGTKTGQFVEAIKTLANNSPDNVIEKLRYLTLFKFNHQRKADCIELLESFIEYYQEISVYSHTPDCINSLCAAILSPINGTLYDGVAGLGSSLLTAYDYSKSQKGALTLYGQEISDTNYAIMIVRTFFRDIPFESIHNGDTLLSPMNLGKENKKLRKFDYSIMFPPFGQQWNQSNNDVVANCYGELSKTNTTSNTDWIYVQHMYLSLDENHGKGIIGIPSGALFNKTFNSIKEELLHTGHIESIISLPSGVLSFTGAYLCLLVINKALEKNSNILMIDITDKFKQTQKTRRQNPLTDKMIDMLIELYGAKKNTEHSRVVATNDIVDGIILPGRYVNSRQIITSDFGRIHIDEAAFSAHPWVQLRYAGRFFRGVNISNHFEEYPEGDFSIINYQDIQNGELQLNSLRKYRLKSRDSKNDKLDNYKVDAGDILISCKGATVKTCIVPKHSGELFLSLNFAGIRINHKQFLFEYVKYYLDSPVGQYLIKSRQMGSSSIITLNIKDLETIPIPMLPLDKQQEYCEFLYNGSEYIYKAIESLQKQLINLRWTFYEKVGLNTVMTKEP